MELLQFILELLKGLLFVGIILFILWLLLAIILYIITSYIMEKHSMLKYGKSTVLVWIPIARLYYLGKEIHSEYLGYGLIILRVLFLFDGIAGIKILFLSAGIIYKLVLYGLFIYLYSKTNEVKTSNIKDVKIKKEK